MTAVRVDTLTKRFGAVTAAAGVAFALDEGAFLTLLGPSGCGKSTILRCLAGLETPDDGRIALGGEVVFDRAQRVDVPTERRGLGMVFQSYAVWPHLTVARNVAFGVATHGADRAAVDDAVRRALALVRLEGLGERYPSQLSGGQLQRVALARALAYRPRLLLLDEPLANLDAHLREEMRAELRRIQRETGTAMVAVTHDQSEALAMSDRVLVLDAGRVEQDAAPRELFEHPASAFVAAFLGARNALAGDAEGGVVRVGGEPVARCAPSLRGPVEIRFRADGARLVRGDAVPDSVPVRVTDSEFLGTTCHVGVDASGRALGVVVPAADVPRAGEHLALVLESTHVYAA